MESKKNTDLLQKARAYAFLLLKFRVRSEKELRQRLKKKKFEPATIESTVSFLKDKKFIDDNYFAKAWIESRIKRPLGIRRIRQELAIKGIDQATIDSQLGEIKKYYCEEEVVTKIAKDRFSRIKDTDPQIAKRRVFSYLIRRGFSPEIVMEVINEGRYH